MIESGANSVDVACGVYGIFLSKRHLCWVSAVRLLVWLAGEKLGGQVWTAPWGKEVERFLLIAFSGKRVGRENRLMVAQHVKWQPDGGGVKGAGFSLMELLVVLAVVAVLAATVVPLVADNIPRFQLKSAARVLLADFQRAKVEAVKRNCNVEIRFSPGTYDPAGEVGSYQLVEMCGGTSLLSRTMPQWVSLYQTNFTNDTTGYQPDGLPIRTGSVWLRNNKSVYYRLAVSVAGNVSLSMGTLP